MQLRHVAYKLHSVSGWVKRTQSEYAVLSTAGGCSCRGSNRSDVVVERLPASRFVWTVNAVPATWRGRAVRDGKNFED